MVPAEQTERRNLIMVNPIEGNTYATTRHLVAAYQCVMAGDTARTHRHSAAALRLVHRRASPAPTRSSTAPASTWRRATWCSRRRGAGTATSTRATRPATGSTSSTFPSCSSARRCSSSPIRAAGWSRSPRAAPTPMRIPSGKALGPGRDAKTVEIAKDVMPTIALHLIRQPQAAASTCRRAPPTTSTPWSAARRASPPRAGSPRRSRRATCSRCRAGTRTHRGAGGHRWCSASPTSRSSPSSGWRGRRR